MAEPEHFVVGEHADGGGAETSSEAPLPMPEAPHSLEQAAMPQLGPDTDLRAFLADLGFVDLLDVRLVEELVGAGKLPRGELPGLVAEAQRSGSSLAAVAELHGLASDNEALRIRADLNNMEPVTLAEAEVEEGIAHLLSADEAVKWQCLPYSRTDIGELLVAIADPEDIAARDQIQRHFNDEQVIFRLAAPAELALFIDRIYDASIDSLTEGLSAEGQEEKYAVRDIAVDQPIVHLVDSIIERARSERASDIHIEPRKDDTVIRFRVDGVLREVHRVKEIWTPQLVARLKTLAHMRTDERRTPQDGRISVIFDRRPLDLRVVTVPTVHGEQVTMRLLDPEQAMMPLEELGMSPANLERYLRCIRKPHGVALITGPTGSGKSTTLYSSLQRIITPEQKIVSIEDPVEYRLEGMTQIDVSSGRLVSDNVSKMTFANALRAILRSDPDIIMVGEIRDAETAAISVNAAMTGHFLFSTLHTNDALSAVLRMEKLKVEPFLIAETLEVIVAQRLVRRLCTHCKQPFNADLELLRVAGAPKAALDWVEKHGPRLMYKPAGCAECSGSGYRGRIGVHEVIEMTAELRRAIIEGKSQAELEQIARGQDMASLHEDTFIRAWEGLTSPEEVARVVS